jgi:peroxiredoxin
VDGVIEDARGKAAAGDIDGAFVPRPRSDVTAVVLDGEAVLLAEGRSEAHYLDAIATLVWGTFDGSATLDELAVDFADAFGADAEVVRTDIVELTQGIGRAGLLEGVAYEAPPPPSFTWPTGVDVGEAIPGFRLPDAEGAEVALGDLATRPLLLVNWSPRCGFCTSIATELAALQPALRRREVDLVFVTVGTPQENAALLAEHGLRPRVLYADGRDVEAFAGVGTPSAYLVDPGGTAASALTIGADQVPTLARRAAGEEGPDPPGLSTPPGALP